MFARSAVTLAAVAALGTGVTVAAGGAQAAPILPQCTRHLTMSTVAKGEGTVAGRTVGTSFTFTIGTTVVPPAGATGCVLAPLTAVVSTTAGTAGVQDFAAVSSTLSWPAGASTKRTVVVRVVPDASPEPNETFSVTITGPAAAHPTLASAAGVILNDDTPPIPVCQPGFICHG